MTFQETLFHFFEWWFIDAPRAIWRGTVVMLEKVLAFFSIETLISTLFLPWKRDAQPTENLSLDAAFRALIGNLISRGIGFLVRIFTIVAGVAVLAAVFLIGGLFLLAFMIWPPASAILIGRGLALIFNS